jgi:hypothetical protein
MTKLEMEVTIEAQATVINDLTNELNALETFRKVVAHALMRPDFCSLAALTMYVNDDIGYLQSMFSKHATEIERLTHELDTLKKSMVVDDGR